MSLVPRFPLQLGGEGEESPCDETQDVSHGCGCASQHKPLHGGRLCSQHLFHLPLPSLQQPGQSLPATKPDVRGWAAPRGTPQPLGAIPLTRFTSARCSGAYVGERCQLPNPCLSSPCKNAGTCTALVRGSTVDYTCACRLGFTDELCLTPRDNVCLSNPCRNGGTCDLLTLSEYKCRCPPGWSGEGWHLGTRGVGCDKGLEPVGSSCVKGRLGWVLGKWVFFKEKRDKVLDWSARGGGVTIAGFV